MKKIKRIKSTVKSAVENGLKEGDKVFVECTILAVYKKTGVKLYPTFQTGYKDMFVVNDNAVILCEKPEVKPIDFSQAGRVLTINNKAGLAVVMTTGYVNGEYFSGYGLKTTEDVINKGEGFNDWKHGLEWIDITDIYEK